MIYTYPAVFTWHDDEEGYSVKFQDLPGCITSGGTLKEALKMADDVLNLWLWDMEYDGKIIPPASRIEDLEPPESGFLSYVLADTEKYTPIMKKNNPQMKIDESRIKKEPPYDDRISA